MDKVIVIIVIVIILVATLFFVWYSNTGTGLVDPVLIPEGIILFYGDGCPHCENVDKYLADNKIEDKVKITHLEVWHNKNNQNVLIEVAKRCNISSNEFGVPFLYDPLIGSEQTGKCYAGDINIIGFFKNLFNKLSD